MGGVSISPTRRSLSTSFASADGIVEHGARSVGVAFLERYAEGPLAYDDIVRPVRTAARLDPMLAI